MTKVGNMSGVGAQRAGQVRRYRCMVDCACTHSPPWQGLTMIHLQAPVVYTKGPIGDLSLALSRKAIRGI